MLRTMLKSKIHRATVTQADLHYVGSVTVDEDLLDAAGLLPGEQVAIVDITNGARLETYVIPGERGSGVIGINGAAAHLVHPGDLVILISYGLMDETEARSWAPKVVHVDAANRIAALSADPAEPVPGGDTVRGNTARGEGNAVRRDAVRGNGDRANGDTARGNGDGNGDLALSDTVRTGTTVRGGRRRVGLPAGLRW